MNVTVAEVVNEALRSDFNVLLILFVILSFFVLLYIVIGRLLELENKRLRLFIKQRKLVQQYINWKDENKKQQV